MILTKLLRVDLTALSFIALLYTPLSAQTNRPKIGSFEFKVEAAKKIDTFVARTLKKNKQVPPALVDDAKFLRRAYLVLNGRIPNLEEVKRFSLDTSEYKRPALLQQLLHTPGYNSHTINFYYDLLRTKERFTNNQSAAPYLAWVRKAVENNTPWDKFVKQLLEAKGSIWQNGAVGYYIRDKGMNLDNLANTTRLFTGTRMECAQCHDHPYNSKIDRMDFYRLAAFSNGFSEINADAYSKVYQQLNNESNRRKPYSRFVRKIGDSIIYTSRQGLGIGRIKLPKDYQYNDGDPHEIVGARTPFEKKVRMTDRRDGDDGIERFSKWITQDNQRFTSVITNRMWKRIMGTGLYEPVDQYIAPDKTSSPQLSQYLNELMIKLNYDLKEFQHVLLLTKTFSFETSKTTGIPALNRFQGRRLTRLTAEQIWDSFITLKVPDPDKLATRKFEFYLEFSDQQFGTPGDNMKTISTKILAIKDPKKLNRYLAALYKTGTSAKKSTYSSPLKGIHRASELTSPAPLDHLLREFGQSDRELIENSSSEANVNQILSILNGHVEKLIVSDKKAHIYSAIKPSNSIDQNITNLFLATLTRMPSKVELLIFKEEINQSGEAGYANILSALLTSREFLFLQ